MNHMTIDSPDAPWHDDEPPYKEVEVCVSISLSRTLKLKVNDYSLYPDDDGRLFEDFSECDLKKALTEQYMLPQSTLPDWNVDEFEVVLE